MKILSIGTDKTALDVGSVVNQRQVEYYKNFESAVVVLLVSGQPKEFSVNNVSFKTYGGSSRLICFFRTYFGLRKRILKNKYDLTYSQDVLYCGLLGLIFKKLYKIKLVSQLHGDYIDNPLWINQRVENRLLNIVAKNIIKNSDYIRAVSQRIVEYYVNYLDVDKNIIKSLPIGIDGDIFNTKDLPSERKKQIVFVGRLMSEKEPHFFCDIVIPILHKHADFKAVIIGDGPLKSELEKRFAEENLLDRAIFPGFLKFPEIAKYYKESFIFLHTAFWEGWGLPMVESTACGLPNVTTDTGCAGEVIIHEENGIIVKTKNKQDYIDAIVDLINDPVKYKKLVENCLKSGDEWTFAAMREKIEKFLIHAKQN